MKQCPHCNEVLGDNSPKCFKCGYIFNMKKPMLTSFALKIIAWILLAFLLIVGIIIGVVGTYDSSSILAEHSFNTAGMFAVWGVAIGTWLTCAIVSSILHHLEGMHR